MVEARFDDVVAGRSFMLTSLASIVEARSDDEVIGALDAVDEAAGRGLWAAGYVAYDAAPGIDAALQVRPRSADDPSVDMPLAWFGLFEERREVGSPEPPNASYTVSRWLPSVSRVGYGAAIERIREHIRDGDTYQVNHTLRLRARFLGTDRAFYTALCLAQRGSFCAYLDTGGRRVLSASPELFFELGTDGVLVTRPMKGTAPRGRWLEEDEANAARLLATEKERAENAMIVDLLRNDMGRISEPGSVRVGKLFDVERYETLWQLTSTVESKLPLDTPVREVFRALFPSGSVTGAPKVRSMQIIAEAEDSPRGIYTGAIGYLAPRGAPAPRASFNVAIRTVVLDPTTETLEYGVGGGITFDSSAEREYQECRTKARVLTERRPSFELIESIRLEDGELLWLDRHLRRLAASAEYFGFDCDLDRIRSTLARDVAEAAAAAGKVRITLSRAGRVKVKITEIGPAARARISIDATPVDPDDVFLFHKTTHRDVFECAAARHPEADEVVMVNRRGDVTEATSSNVAARIDGRWLTPPRSCGCLSGVYREVLLEEGKLHEGTISPDRLRSAEEIALINSVRLWREAELL